MVPALLTTAGLLILYIVSASYRITRSEFDTIKWFILCSGFLAAIAIIYEYSSGMMYYAFRATLFIDDRIVDPNKLAFDMLFPLSVGISMILQKKHILMKTVLLLMLGVIVFSIIITGSRGGMAGALIILAVYMVFGGKE